MKKALLISNANAGTADRETIAAAMAVLSEHVDVHLTETANAGELDEALASRGDADLIFVAGGDGSLHAVVASLYARGDLDDVVIGLLPLGTGNDFARGVGVPLDAEKAAHGLCRDDEQRIDLIVDDNDNIVINAVHLGATAEAGNASQVWKTKFGPTGYLVGGVVAGFGRQGIAEAIEVDGKEVSMGRVASVAINNGVFVGGGTPLGPDADPSDGKLAIHISYSYGRISRLGYALHVRRGSHTSRPDVVTMLGERITVRGEPFTVSADGEIEEGVKERTWSVRPGAVRLLLPPEVPRSSDTDVE